MPFIPTHSGAVMYVLCIAIVLLPSCTTDEDMFPDYIIPETYTFQNVDYSGQTTRLAMLSELKSYMAGASEPGTLLDVDRLTAMFANDAANASWSQEYDASKQLRSKTFPNEQEAFDALLVEIASASASEEVASEGVAGRATSLDGAKTYLLGTNGIEYAQLIEKGLMGACFYYQSTAVYFGDEKMNVDNVTIEPGEGTEMEHHWDEAFGYLGVPIDFPTNTDGLIFWGNYANGRDALLNCNSALMQGFLKGRAAISNDDLDTRDLAIDEVRDSWELVAVGSALHYLNAADTDFEDLALKAHFLSEAIGFIYSLQFNPDKKIDNGTVSALLTELAGSGDFLEMNLYPITQTDILSVRDQLAAAYGLEDLKTEF